MANDNHLSSVTLYNVTMTNTKYYNEFFELGQQKINFNFFEAPPNYKMQFITTLTIISFSSALDSAIIMVNATNVASSMRFCPL